MTSSTVSPGTTAPAQTLQRNSITVAGIVFLVLAAASPIIGLTGAVPVTMVIGNGLGVTMSYLIIGALLLLFSVEFVLMSRHVTDAGALYAYVGKGLGSEVSIGVAGLAVYAYTAVQAAIYAFFGATVVALLDAAVGVALPWWVGSLALVVVVQVFGYLRLELGAKVLGVLLLGEWGVMLAMAVSIGIQGGAGEGFAVDQVFSVQSLLVGAPGVALTFAFASSLGFEAAAVFGEEVANPRRAVPRATYLSVILIAGFFAITTWMITVGYGPSNVLAEAGRALESRDTASFIYALGSRYLGPWAPAVMGVFIVTSIFAAALAFHNGIARYLFTLGRGRVLPSALGRVHPKTGAPYVASVSQSIGAVAIIVIFAALGADPIATVFNWGGGIAVVALVVAYLLVSVSVIVHFRRTEQSDATLWNSLVAPALSVLGLGGALVVIVSNFGTLVGGGGDLVTVLILTVAAVFVGGVTRAVVMRVRTHRGVSVEALETTTTDLS
ncbi:APC family permease [Plantibacter sp. LMC-P-059a]|uniref:APC family permease n=1 Tax=Plantibacter sp. LMC-P-059a TaxID=3040297 RepID=UPI00254CEA49|nr:APC family permease [Plantibacter sp. LMC-P-059a]